jgi:hypothetical protein
MLVINFSLLYTYGTEKYEKTKTNKTIKKQKFFLHLNILIACLFQKENLTYLNISLIGCL